MYGNQRIKPGGPHLNFRNFRKNRENEVGKLSTKEFQENVSEIKNMHSPLNAQQNEWEQIKKNRLIDVKFQNPQISRNKKRVLMKGLKVRILLDFFKEEHWTLEDKVQG